MSSANASAAAEEDAGVDGKIWQLALALSVPVFLLLFQGPGLWTKSTFRAHRVGGFSFLVQYSAAWYLLITDYETYASSVLPFTIALNLVAQVCTAIYHFRFLPKKTDDPGIYSDKGTLPYAWVCEALFFALCCLWGNCYYDDRVYAALQSGGPVATALECLWVFLPFALLRPFFPKTHFSDIFKHRSKNTSEGNVWFYDVGTYLIKAFYVAHKHMIGFFFNYVRFLGALSADDMYWLRWMMLVNVGTQAIGTFTHTLRFKKMLGPRTSYGIYVAYAYASYYALLHLWRLYPRFPAIAGVAFTGMVINFAPRNLPGAGKLQGAYQWIAMAWMLDQRYGWSEHLKA